MIVPDDARCLIRCAACARACAPVIEIGESRNRQFPTNRSRVRFARARAREGTALPSPSPRPWINYIPGPATPYLALVAQIDAAVSNWPGLTAAASL